MWRHSLPASRRRRCARAFPTRRSSDLEVKQLSALRERVLEIISVDDFDLSEMQAGLSDHAEAIRNNREQAPERFCRPLWAIISPGRTACCSAKHQTAGLRETGANPVLPPQLYAASTALM